MTVNISRSHRITVLLVLDFIFFLTELVVGYRIGSLALVADSFHMLNDVLSLLIAFYAVKLAARRSANSRYSYGWQRAEILAALINGVFLLALCVSIVLNAVERFFSIREISDPRLIIIVGSLGLVSNIFGLFLFHEHGGSHGHSHEPKSIEAAEPPNVAEQHSGDVIPLQPAMICPYRLSPSQFPLPLYGHPAANRASVMRTANEFSLRTRSRSPSSRTHRSSILSLYSDAAREVHHVNFPVEDEDIVIVIPEDTVTMPTQLMTDQPAHADQSASTSHRGHNHSHSHSMNMRALVLHILGDLLGNVGVIATGLIIWLAKGGFRYYFDPVVSIVIALIICYSAFPLVRSASFILLQGVPSTVSIDDVRSSILSIDGVRSLHDLHIWQLSENKLVASMHVVTSLEHDFMLVASNIRKVLHQQGIHSSTIQPEYHDLQEEGDAQAVSDGSCLILCPQDQKCDPLEHSCCPPKKD